MPSDSEEKPVTQDNRNPSRRELLRSLALGAVGLSPLGHRLVRPAGDGRLSARVREPTASTPPGLLPLGLGGERDGFLYTPKSYKDAAPAPLVLLLHGAGQRAHLLLDPMQPLADELGLILLAVDSRGPTWAVSSSGYGADIGFIDAALAWAFARVRVRPSGVAVAGFSDGASYALSIGTINGDLFPRIAAFSPGFMGPGNPHGHPRIFISHGTNDRILPIDRTSRVLVPTLKKAGYDVEYHEFAGPHWFPDDILRQAAGWIARS
jgi:phospholipase/carboxylesterase